MADTVRPPYDRGSSFGGASSPLQPSDDLIRFQGIKAVAAVKALECALALASGRKR
jgi:hypothetical protein